MNKTELLERIDAVIVRGKATVDSVPPPPALADVYYNPDHRWVKDDLATAFRIAGLSVLLSLYGQDHQFYKDFNGFTNDKRTVPHYRQAHALMEVVRDEVARDWFYDTRALIAADVFSDFLEMAGYLLSEGYKDAAAVLVGGSVEGHLRSLALGHKVDTHFTDKNHRQQPKKAESLNQDLLKANAYSTGDLKAVTAWLDIRNNAAHSHYDEYTEQQVATMLAGVKDFIGRVPA